MVGLGYEGYGYNGRKHKKKYAPVFQSALEIGEEEMEE